MKEKEKNETMFLVKDPPMYTKRSRQSKLINNHLKTKSVGEKRKNHLKLMSPYYFSYETIFFCLIFFYDNIL